MYKKSLPHWKLLSVIYIKLNVKHKKTEMFSSLHHAEIRVWFL